MSQVLGLSLLLLLSPKNLKKIQKSENLPKISLIKCLKGHKSLGSLFSVVKTLIVSLVRQTKQARDNESY